MKTINNNIEECLCNFENSELLKEAGFELNSTSYYQLYDEGQLRYELIEDESYVDEDYNNRIAVCTIQLAIDWIRVNWNVHIDCRYLDDVGLFGFVVTTMIDNTIVFEKYYFKTPDEAKQAAIKFVLKKLILKK